MGIRRPYKFLPLFLLFSFSFHLGWLLSSAFSPSISHAYGVSSNVWGYASDTSKYQNENIELHVSSNTSVATGFVFNSEDFSVPVEKISFRNLHYLSCPYSEYGCNWPVSKVLNLSSAKYKSGLYIIYLFNNDLNTPPSDVATNAGYNKIVFVVKEDDPGSTSNILYVHESFNLQAYNRGDGPDGIGGCFYPYPQCREQVPTISFNRPLKRSMMTDGGAVPLWLKNNNYVVEYGADEDLEDLSFVKNYRLIIISGHEEYWTSKMKKNMERFRDLGGNLLFFASNVVYNQVSYNASGRTLTAYKQNYSKDPYYNKDNNKVRTLFERYEGNPDQKNNPPLRGRQNNHNAQLLGIHAGQFYVAGDYRVYQTDNPKVNWVFHGLDLHDGDILAGGEKIAGDERTEVDKIQYKWVNHKPVRVDSADMTPLKNVTIIGQNVAPGGATMAIYTTKDADEWGYESTVIATGSWNWGKEGLRKDVPEISQMTRNMINRMSHLPSVSDVPIGKIHKITLSNGENGYYGIKDAYITSWQPDTGFSNTYDLRTRLNAFTSLIYTDFTPIPQDSEIVSASLIFTFRTNSKHDFGFNYMDLVPLKRTWAKDGKSTATWNKAINPSVSWSVRGAKGVSDADYANAPVDRQWGNGLVAKKQLTFDLTDRINEFIDGGNNYGFLINGNTYFTNYFYSSDNVVPQEYRPKLIILYKDKSGGGEEPPSTNPSINLDPSSLSASVNEGEVLERSVAVKNNGNVKVDVRIVEDLDWVSIDTDSIDSLDVGDSKVVKFKLNYPTHKQPGKYSGSVRFNTYYNGEKVHSSNFNVTLEVVSNSTCDKTFEADIAATVDTQVSRWNKNADYSTSQLIYTRPNVIKPLFYFDLNSLPEGAQVVSAKFGFTVVNDRNMDFTYTLYPLTKDWQSDSSHTNWEYYRSNKKWNTAGIGTNDKINNKVVLSGVRKGRRTVDIKSFVQNWLNDSYGNNGFVIESSAGANVYQSIYSSNFHDKARTPSLTITYKNCQNGDEDNVISVTPSNFKETIEENEDKTVKLTVSNVGVTSHTFSISANKPWVDPTGQTNFEIAPSQSQNVDILLNGNHSLDVGTYNGEITINAYTNGKKIDTKTVNIALNVTSQAGCTVRHFEESFDVAKDTYIHAWSPNTSHDTSPQLDLRPNYSKPLLFWDLSKIPTNANVEEANLEFSVTYYRNVPFSYKIYKVKRPWENTSNQTNWLQFSNGENWSQPGALGSSDRSADYKTLANVSAGRHSADLKTLVSDWVKQPSSNNGVIIESTAGARVNMKIASSEYYDSSKRPELKVRYSVCE